jgi:hypothetical protein
MEASGQVIWHLIAGPRNSGLVRPVTSIPEMTQGQPSRPTSTTRQPFRAAPPEGPAWTSRRGLVIHRPWRGRQARLPHPRRGPAPGCNPASGSRALTLGLIERLFRSGDSEKQSAKCSQVTVCGTLVPSWKWKGSGLLASQRRRRKARLLSVWLPKRAAPTTVSDGQLDRDCDLAQVGAAAAAGSPRLGHTHAGVRRARPQIATANLIDPLTVGTSQGVIL